MKENDLFYHSFSIDTSTVSRLEIICFEFGFLFIFFPFGLPDYFGQKKLTLPHTSTDIKVEKSHWKYIYLWSCLRVVKSLIFYFRFVVLVPVETSWEFEN